MELFVVRNFREMLPQRPKVTLFAAVHEAFGYAFQLLPARANLFGFLLTDVIIGRCACNHGKQIGEFLDDLVGGRYQEIRVRVVDFGIPNKKPASLLTNPMDEPGIVGAFQ